MAVRSCVSAWPIAMSFARSASAFARALAASARFAYLAVIHTNAAVARKRKSVNRERVSSIQFTPALGVSAAAYIASSSDQVVDERDQLQVVVVSGLLQHSP